MLHDVIITVGVYSITGREVTEATVAAVLTVLGYSIYDTIIIFDRIRENVPIMRRQPFATIANISLWETIRRSLATTFITILPVAALFFFGGSTLKDFAFALLIGVVSGAYSSIFIAAPLLTIWKEREPEYARRKGQLMPEGRAGEQDARRVRAGVARRGHRDAGGSRRRSGVGRRAAHRRHRSTTPTSARGGGSAGARVRMDAPGNGPPERDALERILALLGPRLEDVRSCSTMQARAGAATRPRVGEGTQPARAARSRASSGS